MASDVSMRGRLAPSPSGEMHLGNAFSALLAWSHARSQGGDFVLRLENLDERCRKPEVSDNLIADLEWLGLDWDGAPLMQSDRTEEYAAALERIEQKAELYPCFCTRADLHAAQAPHASDGTVIYPGTCHAMDDDLREELATSKRHALRIHVPDRTIAFDDLVFGSYEQNLARECGDFVVRRSDGVFAYQLACVVDDIHSGVTHVMRGSDLLASTPRQIMLCELLDASAPTYAHHPLLLASDGRRLSKRDGDLSIAALRDRGVAPQKIVGHVAAWSGQVDEPEPMTADELAGIFDIGKVPRDDVRVSLDSLGA